MLVLVVLLAAWVGFRGAGALGVEAFASWPAAARWALAVMLLFTASAHFTSMREDLVRMVPRWVPWPRAVIYFTGVCEVLGAIGLLVPAVRGYAGIALIVFFIAVFPANVRAARDEVSLRGRPATPLWLRAPMQLLFIALTWWSSQANQ
jgi:uncharacterized membrane protein